MSQIHVTRIESVKGLTNILLLFTQHPNIYVSRLHNIALLHKIFELICLNKNKVHFIKLSCSWTQAYFVLVVTGRKETEKVHFEDSLQLIYQFYQSLEYITELSSQSFPWSIGKVEIKCHSDLFGGDLYLKCGQYLLVE